MMNEKLIELLWWKARIGYNNQQCDPEVLGKFAELIVRECAVPMITQARTMDVDGRYQNNPIEVTAMNLHQGLLKHFGVEE